MKKLEEISDLEKRSLARWIRRRMQGRVDPTIWLSEQIRDFCSNILKNIEDKKEASGISGKMKRAKCHVKRERRPALYSAQLGVTCHLLPMPKAWLFSALYGARR